MTPVLYIGGIGRSGSTLLERICGEIPGVCALGEVTQLWDRVLRDDTRCGCGALFAGCDFWQAVGEKAFGGWERAPLGRPARLQRRVARTRQTFRLLRPRDPGRLALIREYAGYYQQVYDAAAAVTGARLIVDSSKNPALAMALRWLPTVDLRVVHLVRDPRGVAYSWTKHMRSGERVAEAKMLRLPPARSAWEWNAHNTAMQLLASSCRRDPGGRVKALRVRYEDLIARPAATMQELLVFAELDQAGIRLPFAADKSVRLTARHSVAGNPMRFTSGNIELRPDDAWRSRLPAQQRALVTALCAPLLRSYGYPLWPSAGLSATHVTSGHPEAHK